MPKNNRLYLASCFVMTGMRLGVAIGVRVCVEVGVGITGAGHFAEFTAHAKSVVGRGCNVAVDDGDAVGTGEFVAVGGAI